MSPKTAYDPPSSAYNYWWPPKPKVIDEATHWPADQIKKLAKKVKKLERKLEGLHDRIADEVASQIEWALETERLKAKASR